MSDYFEYFKKPISNKVKYLQLITLTSLALLIYYKSMNYGYALDDVIVASENKFVQKGFKGLKEIFTKESFTGYFGEQMNLVAGSRYRPLSIASFAIEKAFFGVNPKLSHVFNILFYIISLIVIYLTTKKIFRARSEQSWIAFFTTLIFLVHPVHVEAVANIKGRDEIFCFIFSFLSLYYFIEYYDLKKIKYLILSCVYLFLGLLSKENAITFVAIIPLVIYFFRDANWKYLFKISLPLLIASILFIGLRVWVIGFLFDRNLNITDLMNDPFVEMNGIQKYCTITLCIAWYIKLLFIPYPLTHDYYPYHVPIVKPDNPLFYVSLCIIFILIIIALLKWRKKTTISFSILFFFISISLISNVLFTVGTFMNERFIFIASFGFCLALVHSLFEYDIWKKVFVKIPLAMIIISIIFITFGFISYNRVPAWQSGDSLNLEAIKVSRNSARTNLFTGVTYFERYRRSQDNIKKYDDLKLASQYIDKSVKIYPNYFQGHNMRAGVAAEWHKKDGDTKKLLDVFTSVISNQPNVSFVNDYLKYLNDQGTNASLLYPFYINLGYEILYKQQRRYDYALQYLGLAYKLNSQDRNLANQIASVYSEAANAPGLDAVKKKEFINQANSFFALSQKQ